MFNIYKNNQNTFYCGCSYKDKIPNLESCGYNHIEKKKASVEWEHILTSDLKKNLIHGGMVIKIKNNGKI